VAVERRCEEDEGQHRDESNGLEPHGYLHM
jgi:hypothetical protein